MLRADGELVAVQIDVQLVFGKAGQLGVQQVAVALLAHVAAELRRVGRARVVPKLFFNIVEIAEQAAPVALERGEDLKHRQ